MSKNVVSFRLSEIIKLQTTSYLMRDTRPSSRSTISSVVCCNGSIDGKKMLLVVIEIMKKFYRGCTNTLL
jgi:hypothetical protein